MQETERLRVQGVKDGRRAFAGPRFVELCITNRCNTDCVLCWGHSPLLDRTAHRRANWRPDQQLPQARLLTLLEELAALGTREIQFSGGGDPLMHEGIFELLTRTRELGMQARLLTNLLLLSDARRRALLDSGVQTIQVSLWAASPATYHATHPNQPPASYDRVLRDLAWLRRRRADPRRPFLLLGHVICRLNAHELEAMFETAAGLADGITLVPMDPIAGSTEQLLPDGEQLELLRRTARRIASRFLPGCFDRESLLEWHGLEEFLRRLDSPRAVEGLYEIAPPEGLPRCTIGWTYARVEADGSVCSCCRATRTPVGNLLQQEFAEVWFGQAQEAFRLWSRERPSDPRFATIDCERTCDNVGHNREMARALEREA